MNMPMVPVLITSSVIAHDKSVSLSRFEDRLEYTLEAIAKWLELSPDSQYVVCDGSGYDFGELLAIRFPNVKLEFLCFTNDFKKVSVKGRGYGEGEIVNYAIKHSKHITAAGCFAKCTAKLWVANYTECLSGWNGSLLMKGVFRNAFTPWRGVVFSYIDTRFYICSVEMYRRLFEKAHENINAAEGQSLEECFKDELVRNNVSNYLMVNPPVIYGVGGGTGVHYRNTPIRRRKEKLRYKIVSSMKIFKPLFVSKQCKS